MRVLLIVQCTFLLVAGVVRAAGAAPAPPHLALWVEVGANLLTLSTRESIAGMLDRAKAAGVDVIMPEAKNAWGFVAYESMFAPHIRTSAVPRPWPPAYPAPATWFPQGFDPLRVLIEEAHARAMQVHAAINVFGEGFNASRVGLAFERPQWQTQHLTGNGRLVPSSEVGTITFVNPASPEVQLYELAVIDEVVRNYDVDGVVLDRIRFPDGTADFSPLSREQFEVWLGTPVALWPDDVLTVNGSRLTQGPLFRPWVAWRATVIQRFIRAAERIVHTVKPDVAFAAFVGGWYPTYWQEGVNWAAGSAALEFPWVTPEWQRAAVAEMFDYLMVGLYFPQIAQSDALTRGLPFWMSVEGDALLARELIGDATRPVGSVLISMYEGDPARFQAALQAALRLTGSVMLFDLSHLELYGWWDYLTP